MTDSNNELGPSFFSTLNASGISDVAQDAIELALDSALADGLAKNIPVINTIVRLGKTAFAIRDYFLIKKVLVFLAELKDVSPQERAAFIRKIETDKDYQRRVGETIILLIDRYDHLDKPRLMAKLFSAYIKDEMDYETFLRLSTAIDKAFIDDLNKLLEYFSGRTGPNDQIVMRAKQNLYTSNLSDFYVLSEEQRERSGLDHPQIYHFNQAAIQLAKAILRGRFVEGIW